ncbi:glycosyltransferase [Deltaproteobacteria bacterium TL4]
MDVQISVVIPTYNSRDLLSRCLKSLENQTAPSSVFEVIVIDDGSTDGTGSMLESFKQGSRLQLKSCYIENAGPANARNKGASLASSEWIAYLDADVFAHHHWISRIIELIQLHPHSGGFEGRTEVPNRHQLTFFTHQTENAYGGRYPTCNLIIRKIFCSFYYKYRIPFREDSDLAFSILESGFQIYFDSELIVYHPPLPASYLRPITLAKRYFYNGLLRRRFPHRYRKELDVNKFFGLPVPHLKVKLYGVFIVTQILFIASWEIGPWNSRLLLGTGSIYLASYLYGCVLSILRTDPASRNILDFFSFALLIHVVPWVLYVYLVWGFIHFRKEPRFSCSDWWDQIGLPKGQRPFDIVLISTADWHHPFWTNKQHIASRLALRGHRILYIESLGLRKLSATSQDLLRIFRRTGLLFRGLQNPHPNIHIWSPLILPFHQYALIREINWFILKQVIQWYCHKLQFQNPILWSYNPIVTPLTEKFKFSEIVYHCVDELKAAPGMPAETLEVQEQIFGKSASYIFATSLNLYESRKHWNPNTYYLPNPCDFDHFHQTTQNISMAPELASIPEPRIGFIGAMSQYKVDATLLQQISEQRPDWHLVLVGQIGEGEPGSRFDELGQHQNIHLLGPKPYKELPHYLKGFQVTMLPCPINEYTQNMFPLKFFEYLAAGLPVVSTAIAALVDYKSICYWCESPEEFIQSIEKALIDTAHQSPRIKQGIDLARQNTWDHRVDTMLKILSHET